MIPTFWHSAQLYKDFFSSIAASGFVTGEEGVDKTEELTDKMNDLTGTGGVLFLSGHTQFSDLLPPVDGYYIVQAPGSVLEATEKTNLRIRITGTGPSGIIGGEIRNKAMRRYRISAVSQAGGAGTSVTITLLAADLADPLFGAHDFVAGETLYVQNIVLTAGTINGIVLTVASVTVDTVTFAAVAVRDIADTTVYPYDRLDGHGRTIYPVVYRSRGSSFSDTLVDVISATDFLVRDVTLRWSAINGLSIRASTKGVVENVLIKQTAADGLHITAASGDISLRNIDSRESGDDGVAVVSYKKDGGYCYDIRMENIRVADQWFNGRGLSVLGGQNIQAHKVNVTDAYGAGIMIAYDATYETYGCIGILIDEFTLKTTGNSGAVPTGWGAATNSGVMFIGGGTPVQNQLRSIELLRGRVQNSRYRGLGNTSAVLNAYLHDIEFIESEGAGCDGLPLSNGRLERITFERARQHGISMSSALMTGINKYIDLNIVDCNRGARLFLKSAGCAAGVLTLVLEPGTSHSLAIASAIQASWISSSYAINSNENTEVQKDYALNSPWILTDVTADAAGDILTVTVSAWVTATPYSKGHFRSNTGVNYVCVVAHTSGVFATDLAAGYWRTIADTAHARTRNPAQAHPHAYVSLQSGDSASIRGMNIDTDTLTGKTIIENPTFGAQTWPLQYTVYDNGANPSRLFVEDVVSLSGSAAYSAGAPSLYMPEVQSDGGVVTADSAQTITIDAIRRGAWLRNSLTAPRSDTTPTAAAIVAAIFKAGPNSSLIPFHVWNFSGQVVTLVGGAGVTISGTATIAATTMMRFGMLITATAAGAEAVTFTRQVGHTGLTT